MEARVARARQIPYQERRLSATVADFYLLETLANVKHDPIAKPKLEEFETDLSREFAAYLDIAIGGELRYAKSALGDDCPERLAPFVRETKLADRGTAWLVWGVIRRAWGVEALRIAEDTFLRPGWRGAFGGEPWANITLVLRSYLEGKMNNRIFVDRCFSLEHHSGCCFNKLYNTRDVPAMLEAHGADDYRTLLAAASDEVRCLWRRHEFLRRIEHDEAWYGIPADLVTSQDVANWEDRYGWRAR